MGQGLLAAALAAALTMSGGAFAQEPAAPVTAPVTVTAPVPASASASAPASASASASASAPESAPESDSGTEERPPSWTTIAIGGVVSAGLLGIGMAFFSVSSDKHTQALGLEAVNEVCSIPMPPAECSVFDRDPGRVDSLESQSGAFQAIGAVTFVAGWLVAGATVAYAVWPRDDERGRERERQAGPAVQATPVVGPGTAGLVLSGRF